MKDSAPVVSAHSPESDFARQDYVVVQLEGHLAYLGYTVMNRGTSLPLRRGWSSRSDSRVVLALWSNLIVNDGQEYRDDKGGNVEHDARLFADKQRREHLAYSIDQLHGEVLSIIVTKKPGSTKEAIESQEVGPAWRVTKFNPKTGAFRLERITFANRRRTETP